MLASAPSPNSHARGGDPKNAQGLRSHVSQIHPASVSRHTAAMRRVSRRRDRSRPETHQNERRPDEVELLFHGQ